MTDHLGDARVADTTPYAWPYDGNLDARGTAVLVIQPECPWPSAVEESVIAHVAEVVASVRAAGGRVLSLHTAPPPSHTQGGASPTLPDGEQTFVSAGIDGFYGTALEARLRTLGVSRLIIVGLGAETTIHSTMRTANDMGYECLFVADACAPYDPTLQPHTVSMIEMSGGIFGAVGTAQAVIAAFSSRSQS